MAADRARQRALDASASLDFEAPTDADLQAYFDALESPSSPAYEASPEVFEESLSRQRPGETIEQTIARRAAASERLAERERRTGISRTEVLQSDGAGGFNVLRRSGAGYEVVGHRSSEGLVTRTAPGQSEVVSVFEPPGFEPGPNYVPFGEPPSAPMPEPPPIPSPVPIPEEEFMPPYNPPGEPAPYEPVALTPGEAAPPTAGLSIPGILGSIPGIFGGGSPCAWAMSRYPTASAAAAAFGQQKPGFASIDPGQNNGASTAYLEGGRWMVNMCRGGVDSAAGDVAAVGTPQPLPGGGGTVPGTPGPGLPAMPGECATAGPVAPRVIQQRRCPPGMRLAKNDQCYPEKTLPKQWYKNDPKPAKISYGEWKNFQKAGRTATKIENIAEKAEEFTGKKAAAAARRSAAKARAEVKMLTDGS